MDVSKTEDGAPAHGADQPGDPVGSEEMRVYEEGCLSIPEYYEEVERPDRVRFRYTISTGETVEQEAEGLMATCVQHEIDHLNGVLFIDHLSKLKRDRVMTKFKKAAKREARAHEPARRLHGNARIRGADALGDRRPRPRGRGRLYSAPAAAGRGMELRPRRCTGWRSSSA